MIFSFVSPVSIQPWFWKDGEDGVGGNEQGVIQFSERLVARGHECVVYCDTPWSGEACENAGVIWRHYQEIDFSRTGVWVLCRCPEYALQIPCLPTQKVWMVVQDFEHDWTADYFDRIDRILFTCQTHKDLICGRYPHLAWKSSVTSNGVRVDLIDELESADHGLRVAIADGVVNPDLYAARNPFKIMWASSPDRGLRTTLKIFSRVREVFPQLELHVFYGFNGIDRIAAQNVGGWPAMEKEKRLIMELAEKTPGVFMRGRVTQTVLYKNWLTSGLMIYPTLFREMSAISVREAQCMGAIPVVTPLWGLKDHVRHGIWVVGDPADEMVQARFAGEIIGLLSNVGRREQMRAEMMADSRTWCDWEGFVDQWEEMANEKR